MSISFGQRVTVPEHVLVRELDGELLILNLDTESYLGLDEVGTRMWQEVTTSGSIEQACRALAGEYDVAEPQLRNDLGKLLEQLVQHKLIDLTPA